MKRLLPLLLCFAMLLSVSVLATDTVVGTEDSTEETVTLPEATNITPQCTVYCNGALLGTNMLDNSYFTRGTVAAGTVIKVVCATPIAGIYARFDQTGLNEYPQAWTLEVNGESRSCGENGFQQQYVGGFSATELTMTFHAETGISDLYFLSEGSLPDWVQVWEDIPEKADLLLMACHSDDDQYIFCGLIPWALAQDVQVHVAYFINHYTHPNRVHELLDGLWASGIRSYPTMGLYRDEEHDTTIESYLNTGYTEEEIVGSQVAVFRRFRPQIVVTHAENGEYGHGAHVLYTRILLQAIEQTADASLFAESAEEYGAWDIPKVYVHCHDEKQVTLDFDTPLEMFGGRTAFKVGQDAFMKEVSQTWYAGQMNWLYGQTLATEVKDYRPIDYGLYRSTVGDDVNTDTLLDNIVLYADQDRLAAEEAARLAAEEEARLAAEAEEAARLAAEEEARLEAEEAERLAAQEAMANSVIPETIQQRMAQASERAQRDRMLRIAGIVAAAVLLCILIFVPLFIFISRKRRDRAQSEVYYDEIDLPEEPFDPEEPEEEEYPEEDAEEPEELSFDFTLEDFFGRSDDRD